MGEPLDFMTRLDNTANATDKKRIYEEILGHLQEAGYRGQQAKQIEIKWKNLSGRRSIRLLGTTRLPAGPILNQCSMLLGHVANLRGQ